MLAHPAVAAGVVILAMFAGLTALVLLIGDGRRTMEREQQDTPPSDFEGLL